MNKYERHIKGEWKRKKRAVHYLGWINNYVLRTAGKPCSCVFCSRSKIMANGVKKKERKELLFQIENDVMIGKDGETLFSYLKTAC